MRDDTKVMEDMKSKADRLKGRWTQLQGTIKSTWGKLTDDDLKQIDGDVDKLVGKVQEKYRMGYEDAKRMVELNLSL